MDSLAFTLLSFLLALAILIAVHEFGHFWVARKLGVRVLRFSIGFGKPLWKRIGKIDDTEYVLAAVPLGGYVKMLDEREGEVAPAQRHRAFNRQSLKVRSAIVAAGPLFNFLFAIFAFWLILVVGDTGTRPWVGEVAEASIADQAGFRPGDELLAVAGRVTPTWEAAVYAMLAEAEDGEDLSVKVRDSDGNEQLLLLPGDDLAEHAENGNILTAIGLAPKRPQVPPVIGQIVPGEAADQAGLLSGDLVLSLDGKAVSSWSELVDLVQGRPGKPVVVELTRAGARLSLPLLIGKREGQGQALGRIGAGVQVPADLYDEYRTEVRFGPLEALGAAAFKTWDMSLFMVKTLGRMLTGQASVKNLGGPISIAQSAGKSASYGLVYFVKFLALVSISLGVLNLLPVPVLDGGHLLFFLIEGLKGSPLSEQAQMLGQRVGMLLLLGLMTLAFYVDISRLLG